MYLQNLKKIAKTICDYSIKVEKGENVFILAWNETQPLVVEIVKAINERGANPFVVISDDTVDAAILKKNPDAYKMQWEMYKPMMDKMDKMVNIRAMDRDALAAAGENSSLKIGYMRPAYQTITGSKPWVLLTYPTKYIAHEFNKSIADMETFWGFATAFDYSKTEEAADKLVQLINRSNKVRIKDAGTDLTFSIEGIGGVPCIGERNLPDGEVYTAPVKDSVQGYITYNQPTPSGKYMLKNVKFKFVDGKIVEATCDGADETAELNKVLDQDAGGRYIGEFAFGFNPFVKEAVGNTLFDEKMVGSFHFTPGNAYANEADNGNRSTVHWDIVSCHMPEFGGGEIYFDDVLIRKDGMFVLEELKGLNPDRLV